MRVLNLVGGLAWAAALTGYVPGTLAYREGFWSSFRQSIGNILPRSGNDNRARLQSLEPREEQESDPPIWATAIRWDSNHVVGNLSLTDAG
ncbi:hypothetical protein P885DRAFT_76357 [Corynascus similis CBS 632.67]